MLKEKEKCVTRSSLLRYVIYVIIKNGKSRIHSKYKCEKKLDIFLN